MKLLSLLQLHIDAQSPCKIAIIYRIIPFFMPYAMIFCVDYSISEIPKSPYKNPPSRQTAFMLYYSIQSSQVIFESA